MAQRMALPAPPQDEKEGHRLQEWAPHEQGWMELKIADALGVTPGAVSQWLKRAREGAGRRRGGGLRCCGCS